MTIKQTISINASAERVYKTLTSAVEFSEMTGAPADISGEEGGLFTGFGGQIIGRHIELTPNKRIIQAWRAGPWDESAYSIVRIDITEADNGSSLTLEHRAYPDGSREHLEGGWHKMYWEPLKAFLE